jgi:hypothetical protein
MSTVHMAAAVLGADVLGPAVAAVLFILLMARVREPTGRKINSVLVAGFSYHIYKRRTRPIGIALCGTGHVRCLPRAGVISVHSSGMVDASGRDLVHHCGLDQLQLHQPPSSESRSKQMIFGFQILDLCDSLSLYPASRARDEQSQKGSRLP